MRNTYSTTQHTAQANDGGVVCLAPQTRQHVVRAGFRTIDAADHVMRREMQLHGAVHLQRNQRIPPQSYMHSARAPPFPTTHAVWQGAECLHPQSRLWSCICCCCSAGSPESLEKFNYSLSTHT